MSKLKLNMKSKLQPEGDTTGYLAQVTQEAPMIIEGNEYDSYKFVFKTKEGNSVSKRLPVDVTEGSLFMYFLKVLKVEAVEDESGEAELDFESSKKKEVGIRITHVKGKAIIFANVDTIFTIKPNA